MPAGRPRTRTPPKNEVIKLGKDLVKWATEPTEELRCRWCQWYSNRGLLRADWLNLVETQEFRVYYEKAQQALGQRFVDGSVNQSIAHRFLRIYTPEVKAEENEEKEFDAKLKKEELKETRRLLVDELLAEVKKEKRK